MCNLDIPNDTEQEYAPPCEECTYSEEIRDPYSTGDNWLVLYECLIEECPWGKERQCQE